MEYKESIYSEIKSVFFNAEGRLSREAFIVAFSLLSLLSIVGTPLIYLLGDFIIPGFLTGLIVFVYSLYLLYATFVVCIKRLHDLNLTGWLSILILAIPLSVLFIAYLVIVKGKRGENQYGEPINTVHPPTLLKASYVFLIGYGIFIFIMGVAFIKGVKTARKAEKRIQKTFKKHSRSMGAIFIDNQLTGMTTSIAKDRILVVGPNLKKIIQASLSSGKKVKVRFADKSSANLTKLLVFNDSPSVQMSVFLIDPPIGTPGSLGDKNKKLLNEMNAFQ